MLVFNAHSNPVSALTFHPNGDNLASACHAGLRVWATQVGPERLLDLPGPADCSAVAFSPQGLVLACVGVGTRAWKLTYPAEGPGISAARWMDHALYAQTCAFSPDGQTFVTQGINTPLRRWDTRKWSKLPGGWGGSRERRQDRQFPTSCIAYHPEGTMLASSYGVPGKRGFDSVIYLRDASSGELLDTLRTEFASSHPTALAFSPTGTHLAGIFGPYLWAWHIPSRAEVAARKVGTKHFKGLAFTPDSCRLVTVSNDESVRLWDTSSWSEVGGFQWDIGKLRSVTVAPDGMRMAAGSSTGKIVIWDVD